MAEEQGTTTATEQTAAVDTSAGSESQGSYLDDAFGDYFADPRSPENAEQAETPENVASKEQAETPEEAGETAEEKPDSENTEEVKEDQKDPFSTAFANDKGELDLEKLMSIDFGALNLQQIDEQAQVQQPQQQVQDDVPEWKREMQEEETYRGNIKQSTTGLLEKVWERIQAGEDPTAALQTVYAETNKMLDDMWKERDAERNYKKSTEASERIAKETRNAKMKELSRANGLAIANTLPGPDLTAKSELYNRIMFGKDAGGDILEDMFVARHPDYAKYDAKKLDEEKRSFVYELQSDPQKLQRHFQRAYRYLAADPKHMKTLMEQVARNKEAQVRSNAMAAQKSPAGSVQRPAKQAAGKWDSYFSAPKTRIN